MTSFLQRFSILGLIGLSVGLMSCDKSFDDYDKDDQAFKTEVLNENETITLPTSSYETQITKALESSNGSDYYTKGTIEYWANNTPIATIDFGDGAENEMAELTVNNNTSSIQLAKQNSGSKYTKVIVEPLVKTDDCTYIVQGKIKYYSVESGNHVGTIDFGDGTCDKWATKIWPSGSYGDKTWTGGSKTFNMDDWLTK